MTRSALVTGGSSGIGFAIAKELARRGYTINLLARDAKKLSAAATLISDETQAPVRTYSADVTRTDQVDAAVAALVKQFGGLDMVVTCAGAAVAQRFEKTDMTDFERLMAVNYFGTLNTVKSVLPALEASQNGRIVIVSSGAGLVGLFGYSAYAPTKFAVRGLAEALRMELKPKGISVHVAYPPDTDTPQLRAENTTKPPETAAITEGGGLFSPERVARDILKAVNGGKFAITTGVTMKLLLSLHSIAAPFLHRDFDRKVAAAGKAAQRIDE